jgi:ABC-type lipoprotein export system ATPase subunit
VVGVTDYFTTASFRRAQAAWEAGVGASLKYLFPNVELRLDVPTARGSGVNIHLLSAADEVDELDRFLDTLQFPYRDRQYRISHNDLIALGRVFRGDAALAEPAALSEGANQFKVNIDQLHEQYRRDKWARERCLVALSGGRNDGSSGLQTDDGAFAALRQSIEAFAHIIFSSSPAQARFWLGDGADPTERVTDIYGGLKPCIHGSDAHDAERLGVPDENRFTWLKGDASFETLRMACLAPDTRAFIGEVSPAIGYGRGRLTEISVDRPQWFPQGSVPINPGLVAIIGARGSGKTALADLIAAGAGSSEPQLNSSSFVRRAGRLLEGCRASASWGEGGPTSCTFPIDESRAESQESVRYLSQQFVERLCAADGVSEELLVEIERVVFNACPVVDRQGASDFRELLDIRLGAAHGRQEAEREAVGELGESITDQRIVKTGLPKKRADLAELRKQLEAAEAQIKELTSQTDPKNAERLLTVNQALEARQNELQALIRRITELNALQTEAQTARTSRFSRYTAKLREDHVAANLTEAEWQAFSIEFAGDVDEIIANGLRVAAQARQAVGGAPIDPEGAGPLDSLEPSELVEKTVSELKVEQTRLERLVGLDAHRTKALATLNSNAAGIRAQIAKLDADIKGESLVDERIADLTQRRLESYAAYFNALLDEETELRELYSPLGDVLSSIGQSVAKLQFSVRRTVDIAAWAEEGEHLLDLRVTGKFQGRGELARVAQSELLDAWLTGDGETAAAAIRDFSSSYSDDVRKQSIVDTSDLEARRDWERNVNRWLYSADHVGLSYSLEYDGLNIERLSPGTRGIVLLLLYLAVDQEEIEPLIIDQPEENLDPESVYSELVNLFRSASARRQIVMVTHNANLVVNTDVDQVIVAHCGTLEEGKLPEMRYLSGGLENPEVRAAVCEVLEGGAEAFRQRARRLQIDLTL